METGKSKRKAIPKSDDRQRRRRSVDARPALARFDGRVGLTRRRRRGTDGACFIV
jgi:hypothetical protein